ncbi:MAG: PqqD family protein [Kiritimatiellae bacterium]|nr:PqqD family protein [Kiritimatiellia bacterium]
MVGQSCRLLKKSSNIITRNIAGETLLVPISGNLADMKSLFSLNEVGEFIWSQLDQFITEDEIAQRVVNAFNASEEEAKKDTADFCARLIDMNLIESESNNGPITP